MKVLGWLLAACAAAGGAGQAPLEQGRELEFRWEARAHAGAPGDVLMLQGTPAAGQTVEFIRTELSYEGRTVKGAPYTAEAVNETVQVLADGNRIVRRNTTQVARDSEGRTRRHEKISGIGPWASEVHEFIMINDPVAKAAYHLDPKTRTARKMPLPIVEAGPGRREIIVHQRRVERGKAEEEEKELSIAIAAAPGAHPTAGERTEALGRRMIEGVVADGTKSTLVIPAGRIGNDRPIEIVTERWYSPELQVTVMSKRSDPRFGETTYRLMNIQRGEPLRSLFEVPPDYKVEAGPAVKIMRREKTAK